MTLTRWLGLLGGVTLLGCLLVGQRSAVTLQAYQVGAATREVHQRSGEVAWLETRVESLASPTRLAASAKEQKLKLVARHTLEDAPAPHPLVRIASWLGGEE